VPTLFRRKSTAAVIEETDTDEAVVVERHNRSYTPSKRERGMETPKRLSTNPRRPGAPAGTGRGPADSKATARQKRLEERNAMMRGEDWALLPRDKGPEKKLARDLVDSRRNMGSLVLGGFIVVILLSFSSPAAAALSELILLVLLVVIAIDSVFLVRRLKRLVRERIPNSTQLNRKLYFYAIMRSTSFRFMRVPKPQYRPGNKI
jgi:hypothetical protein